MDHAAAISSWIVPLLLSIIGAGILGVCWMLKRVLDSNEREHTHLFELTQRHETVLVEHGVRLERVENEVEFISHKERG